MHSKLLEEATHGQLKSFLQEQFDELKKTMPELYRQMECDLYLHIHGPHFTKWKYECAASAFVNEDGTVGPHWTVDETTSLARSKGLPFTNFNEYDFAYTLNMVYSDYYGVISDNVDSYYRVAKAFLEDKDAPSGKAFLYYRAMK